MQPGLLYIFLEIAMSKDHEYILWLKIIEELSHCLGGHQLSDIKTGSCDVEDKESHVNLLLVRKALLYLLHVVFEGKIGSSKPWEIVYLDLLVE